MARISISARFLALALTVSGTVPSGAIMAQSALSEVYCASQEDIVLKLSQHMGAVKTGAGLRGPDAVMEVWTNPSSGDWTLVQSYAEGRACILAMGEYWESLTPDPDANPANAG